MAMNDPTGTRTAYDSGEAKMPRDKSPIEIEFSALESATTRTLAKCGELSIRLKSVLRLPGSEKVENKPAVIPQSPLEDKVLFLQNQLGEVETILDDLIDRLRI